MSPLEPLALGAAAAGLGTLVSARKGRTVGSPLAAGIAVLGGVAGLLLGQAVLVGLAVASATLGVIAPTRLFLRARRHAQRGDLAAALVWLGRARRLRPRAGLLLDWEALWAAAQAWHAQGDLAPAEALRARWIAAETYALGPDLDLALRRFDWLVCWDAADVQARALCELGEVEAGVEALGWLRGRRLRFAELRRLWGAGLAPLAFAGRGEAVDRLTARLGLGGPLRAFWAATAQLARRGEDHPAALARLEALARDPSLPPAVRGAAAERLAAPPAPPALSAASEAILDGFEREVAAADLLRRRAPWRAPVTLALAASFLALFAASHLRGGITDLDTLTRMGALVRTPEGEVQAGFRLLSYGWLHFGWLHLGINTAVVLAVGPLIEAGLGRLWALGCFALSVLGGGLAIVSLGGPGVTLGASGGAMGWLGALAVIALRHPAPRGTLTGRAFGRLAVFALGAQVAIDLSLPEISAAGHLGGLVTGALFTWFALKINSK